MEALMMDSMETFSMTLPPEIPASARIICIDESLTQSGSRGAFLSFDPGRLASGVGPNANKGDVCSRAAIEA
jgi:hypothetical protein